MRNAFVRTGREAEEEQRAALGSMCAFLSCARGIFAAATGDGTHARPALCPPRCARPRGRAHDHHRPRSARRGGATDSYEHLDSKEEEEDEQAKVELQIDESEPWQLKLASPSKINLFLRVLKRRDDGFHELATFFQAISLHDTLRMRTLGGDHGDGAGDELLCEAEGVPTDSSNLVLRALDAFRRRSGAAARFRVRLDKRVPVQAGLGGGSANAATALWGANALSGRPLSDAQLADIGAEFGSDISFFFTSGTAVGASRGEVLEERPQLPPTQLYIVKPKEGLSTGKVFNALDMAETSAESPEELEARLYDGVYFAHYVNDLEAPALRLCPRLADIKTALREAGFRAVLMSGSGTAFFCLGEPDTEFVQIFEHRMRRLFDVDVFEARFLNRKSSDVWYFEPRDANETLQPMSKNVPGL